MRKQNTDRRSFVVQARVRALEVRQEKYGVREFGSCLCGCGRRTPIAKQTVPKLGVIIGEPRPFCRGHGHGDKTGPDYRVDPETGCWLWLKYVNRGARNGYGELMRDGKKSPAHRWYYEQAHGPVPEGMQLDHLCNRTCVNPAHLEPVTGAENVRRGKNAKLTADDVRAIRGSDEPTSVIARRYGLATSTVRRVRAGKTWRDL